MSRFKSPSMSMPDIMRKQLGQKVDAKGEKPLMVKSMEKILVEEDAAPSEGASADFSLVANMRKQIAKEAAR